MTALRSVVPADGTVPVLRTERGMVTTNHTLAAQAGAQMLADGGNAYDAAVAASFVLGVVEPAMSGIGGRASVMTGTAAGIQTWNADPGAPLRATDDMFPVSASGLHASVGFGPQYDVIDDANATGPLAPVVPSAVATVCGLHERFGRLPLAVVMQPAIDWARNGFPADAQHLANVLGAGRKFDLGGQLGAIFRPGGRVPELGELVRQPDLADTLEAIATQGPDGFYRGDFAAAMVSFMREQGGVLDQADLDACVFQQTGAPLQARLGDSVVHCWPGAGGGITTLQAIELFTRLNGGRDLTDPEGLGYLLEALRLSFADRWSALDDPRYGVPTELFLADEHLEALLADRSEGAQPVQAPGGHTTHLCVVDEDRTAVAITQSLWEGFGSGVVVPGTGVVLNGSMHSFTPVPGQVGSIEPGKHGPHSGNPTMVTDSRGRVRAVLGGAGGTKIISGLVQVLLRHVVEGRSLQEAVSHPRVHAEGFGEPVVDSALGERAIARIVEAGADPVVVSPKAGAPAFARINGIEVTETGLSSAIDPFVDSGAAGW